MSPRLRDPLYLDRLYLALGVLFITLVTSVALWSGNARMVEYETPAGRVLDTAEAIWHDGSLSSPQLYRIYHYYAEKARQTGSRQIQDAFGIGARGELLPKHTILSAVLAAPFWILLGVPGLQLLQLLCALLIVDSLYCIVWRAVGAPPRPLRVLLALTFLTQTYIGHHVYSFSYDLHGALLTVLALRFTASAPLWGGLLAMSAIFIRPSHLLLVPFLLLAWDSSPRKVLDRALGALAGLALFLWLNYWMWGSPFSTSYGKLPIIDSSGALVLIQHPIGLSLQELTTDLWRKLFDWRLGMLLYNAALFLSPVLAILRWRSLPRLALVATAASLSYTLYVLSYEEWMHSLVGNRLVLPASLLALPTILIAAPQLLTSRRTRTSSTIT
jgi:hypothetical protein